MNIDLVRSKIENAVNIQITGGAEIANITWVKWRNGNDKLKFSPLGAVLIAALSNDGTSKSYQIPSQSNWASIAAQYLDIDVRLCELFVDVFANGVSSTWAKLYSNEERQIFDIAISWKRRVCNNGNDQANDIVNGLANMHWEMRRRVCNLANKLGGSEDVYRTLIDCFSVTPWLTK